jgi:glycosyltransferase involved in cell wall biosynthesis
VNVWFVHQDAVPPGLAGLIRSYHLARGLRERGHTVTIVASSFLHRAGRQILPRAEKMLSTAHGEIEFLWLRAPSYRGNGLRRGLNMLVFQHNVQHLVPTAGLAPPDVVVGSTPPPFAALGALRLAKRYGVPFVLEVRDLWPQTLVDLGGLQPWHPFVRLLLRIERQLYGRATRIVSVLPNAAGYMCERAASAERIDWIPNGVDVNSLPSPNPPRQSDHFTVVYAGAHGFANGLGTIIEAAALLQRDPAAQRVRLRLIGEGAEKATLRKRAAAAGLANLCFADPVPNERLHEILTEADAFVANVRASPLYKYGISINKLYDYMAMARPTAIALTAFNNPIDEAGAGLSVPADDAIGLARAIAKLAAMSPQQRWEMGLRGRHYVEANHDYGHLTRRFEACLLSAVKDKVITVRDVAEVLDGRAP